MKITVKRWMADQKVNEIEAYGLFPHFEYVEDEELGSYYADRKNDTVTFMVDSIIRESAKAVQVAVEVDDHDGFAHEAFKIWIPKSQIVA